MTINNLNIQSVLRTYHRQLAEGSRLSRDRVNKRYLPQDAVNISPESKKRLLADKISQEVIHEWTAGTGSNSTTQEILNRLRQEYGKPLEISSEDGQNIVFKVPQDGGLEALPETENERLKKRLFDITRMVDYDHLS